ncbi:MAG: glycosyl hydrolase [Bacteroidales bacterium]|nr:glycosyl hydrolase [Bacteroidales bacterium]
MIPYPGSGAGIPGSQNAPGAEAVLVAEVEAEDGVLTGVTVQTGETGYSGTGYVADFSGETDQVTVTVTVPSTGLYELVIWYGGFWGVKTQDLHINGEFASGIVFPASSGFTSVAGGSCLLEAGPNTISIRKNWGYMAVDRIQVFTSAPNVFEIDQYLVDPAADQQAYQLYEFLKTQFGERIISGQTNSHFNELTALAGAAPLLKAGDLSAYTEGYPYLWKDGGHTFGATDDGTVADLINWHNSAGKGLVSLQWHWHAPSDAQPGNNNFYTENTGFDVRQAVIPGTSEYNLVVRDIDAIAAQLQRFEDAGVPVLWRPLHEAGGGWFWWGAHGPAPCLKLYDLIYTRLMQVHQLHNLIWVWSTPEEDWYPGNNKVDVIGYDSYPGSYQYGAQKFWFDRLHELTRGEKLIAMTENGPIPDPDKCFTMEAPWLYFMSWSDLVEAQNETTHLQAVFSHPEVITLESDNALWRSELYPDTWYPGYKDAQGRFFHDFSYAGYRQGEVPMPDWSDNVVDITLPPYSADPTGTQDVTTIIQQALDDVGISGGGVVYLPPGTYRIRESSSTAGADAALHMKYDNVVLRGAGPDSTFVYHDQDHLRQKDIVHIRKDWSNWGDHVSGTSVKIRNDLPEPTRVIPVESVSGFSKGDLVVVRNDMTTAFAAEHLMEGIWDNTWLDGVMFLRKIDSIDAVNNFLVIDIPTRYYLKTRDNARVYHAGPHISECGIENLSFGNRDNPKTGWDEEDYTLQGTGAYDVHASHVMQFKYAMDCWVKNVHTFKPEVNTADIHVLSNCLVMNMCRNITVDSCDFQKPQYEGGGGNGYMFTLNGNDCLVQNSRANHSRHNYDFKFPHSNGNVILNCRGENSKYSSDFHMYLSMANLLDGFTVDGDYLECAFRPWGGTVLHGYPSTQSVFYNTTGESYHTSKDYIIDSRQFDWGIVTGTSGPAANVKTTPVSGTQNGYSFDTSPEDYVEGAGKGEGLRPVSLYRDQLERRLSGYSPAVSYYNVLVAVSDQISGAPVSNAEVILSDTMKVTDTSGQVSYSGIPGYAELSVNAENYTPYDRRTIFIHSDTVVRVNLAPVEHTVTFRLLDSRTHEPFWGVNVYLDDINEVTDDEGYVHYSLPSGSYPYLVDKVAYANQSGTLVLHSDTFLVFYLERTEAYIKFKLWKEGVPVNKAFVAIGADSIETNNLGIAQFYGLPVDQTYDYTVRKEGYDLVTGAVVLVTDTSVQIEMTNSDTGVNLLAEPVPGKILLWPNPATDKLLIMVPEQFLGADASVVDMHGRRATSFRIIDKVHVLDTQPLKNGIYTLYFLLDERTASYHFIKR